MDKERALDDCNRERTEKERLQDELHREMTKATGLEKEVRDIEYNMRSNIAQQESKIVSLENTIMQLRQELAEEADMRKKAQSDNEEGKRASYFQQQKTSEDIHGLQNYLTECERQLKDQK
jgi:hypothetical protein